MKTLMSLFFLSFSLYAQTYPNYHDIFDLQYLYEVEDDLHTYKVYKTQIDGEDTFLFSGTFLLALSGDDPRPVFYLKSTEARSSHPHIFSKIQGRSKSERVFLIESLLNKDMIEEVSGEVEECTVRSRGGIWSKKEKAFCVDDIFFFQEEIRAKLGREITVTFEKKEKVDPCSFLENILHPIQCGYEPGGTILQLKY